MVKTFPDQEGKVRTVDVIFEGKTYRRSVIKLCRMPDDAAADAVTNATATAAVTAGGGEPCSGLNNVI